MMIMMIIILIVLASLPILLIIFRRQGIIQITKTKSLVPPGPPGLLLIGNLHQFATTTKAHIYLWELSKKYGPIMQMKLGSVPILIISSPKLAKEVMKTQDLAFCSRPNSHCTNKLSYNRRDIIFSPYNDYWREMRKITSIHLFSLKKILSFRPIREDEISRTISKIQRLSSSSRDGVVNLSELAMAMTSTLICRVAFGKGYEDDGSEMRKFDELLHETQELAAAFYVSDYFPSFGWVDRVRGLMDRVDVICRKLDSFYQELIHEHLDPNRKKIMMVEEEDILDILIRLKEENSCSFDLGWDNIKALLMDMFIAGTDTSASSTIWTLTALMKAPKIMDKLQSEIRDFIGKKGKVDEDDLQNLPYLKAVVSESLRLYPPVPLLVPRETIEKCNLDGYEIQPKTMVYINAWAIARDPEYWENPHEFLPERFLNSGIDVKGHDFGVIPFGSGRRSCPGMFMGLANVELAIANMLYAFDWELPAGMKPDDIDTDVLMGVTVHKKNSLCLVPTKYYY